MSGHFFYMSRKTAVFIDGFNVYHFILRNDKKFLWLDYAKLAAFLAPLDNIVFINYFSAIAHWDFNKIIRHEIYLRALKSTGVRIDLGEFADKDKIGLVKHRDGSRTVTFFNSTFQAIRQKFYTYEEKQTDVAIGVKMYKAATQGEVDKIILISNDTDFAPALREITKDFPHILLKVYAPVSKNSTLPSTIRKIVLKKHHRHLPFNLIKQSQFPNTVPLAVGGSVTKPQEWL